MHILSQSFLANEGFPKYIILSPQNFCACTRLYNMVYNRTYTLHKIMKHNVMLKCNLIVNCIILYVTNKVKNIGYVDRHILIDKYKLNILVLIYSNNSFHYLSSVKYYSNTNRHSLRGKSTNQMSSTKL